MLKKMFYRLKEMFNQFSTADKNIWGYVML